MTQHGGEGTDMGKVGYSPLSQPNPYTHLKTVSGETSPKTGKVDAFDYDKSYAGPGLMKPSNEGDVSPKK